MLSHGQTTTWGVRVGMKARPESSDWLRRLRSWLMPPTRRQRAPVLPIAYSYWDSSRERFRPPTMEGALDHAAAQYGQSWAITLYSSLG
jgi:hypothetical protein